MSNLRQKSIDGIIWTLIEKYGGQFFALIIGVILARLLTPEDYGLIGMISVFFAMAGVLINSGFGAAYIQKPDANELDASTIFYFNLIISAILYLILWFSSHWIARFYNQDLLVLLIRVSGIVIIVNALSLMQITMLKKEVNFKKKTLISLISIVVSGITGIILALFGFGVWSLVFQQITNSVINCIGLWFFYNWRPRFQFSFTSLRELFSFGSWILLSSLIRTFFNNIYILFIGKFFPLGQLGFYTKAEGYKNTVTMSPSMAVGVVSFSVFSQQQNDNGQMKKSVKKFIVHLLFFLVPICAILFVTAYPLFLILLTEKWLPMVPFFQSLLIIGLFYPINLINIQVLNAKKKSRLNFINSLIKNLLRLLSVIITYKHGIIYIIYGEIIVSIIGLFINGYYTKKMINYGIIEQFKDSFITLAICILLVIVGYGLSENILNEYIKLIVVIPLLSILYLGLQFLFNKTLFYENYNIVKLKLFRNDRL